MYVHPIAYNVLKACLSMCLQLYGSTATAPQTMPVQHRECAKRHARYLPPFLPARGRHTREHQVAT